MQTLNVLRSTMVSHCRTLVSTLNAYHSVTIFRSFSQMNSNLLPILSGSNWMSVNAVRHRKGPRDYFPFASEQKRLKQAGWRVRMLTVGGRRILMRKILKGKHVLSH